MRDRHRRRLILIIFDQGVQFQCRLLRLVRALIFGAPEVAVGRYSSGLMAEWSPSDEYNEAGAASSVPDHANVWTDGSVVLGRVTGVSASGAGFFAHSSEECCVGGVMLLEFVRMVRFRLAGVSALSLDL